MFLPRGQWCDVTTLPDGRVAVVRSTRDAILEALVLGEHEPRFTVDIRKFAPPWHYTRSAADKQGTICTVAQGDDGRALIFIEGRPIAGLEALGPAPGEASVEVKGLDAGWEVYIAREGYYERLTLTPEGLVARGQRFDTPNWPQGFLSADYGALLTDVGRYYAPLGERLLVLPESVDGAIWIGQHPIDPPRLRAARVRQGRAETAVLLVGGGAGSKPHVAQAADGTLVVCAWVGDASWVEVYTPAAIPWGNDTEAPPVPVDPPPPDPPEEKPPVPTMSAAVAADVRAFYDRFPPPRNDEDAQRELQGQLCETIRARHGSHYGWKRADAGRPPSKDALALQEDGRLYCWDCVVASGGPDPRVNVSEGMEALDITEQVFIPVNAVDHLAGSVPVDPGPTDPPPPDPQPSDATVPDLLERQLETQRMVVVLLSQINEKLDAIAARPAAGGGDMGQVVAKIDDLQRDVQAMHTGVVAALHEQLPRRVKF